MNNVVNGLGTEAKLTRNSGARFSSRMLSPNSFNARFRQFGLRIALTRLNRRSYQAKVKSVLGIALYRAPFKIVHAVVFWVAVFVINKWQMVWVRNKSLSNQPMNQSRKLFPVFGQIYAQMRFIFFWSRPSQALQWLLAKTALRTNLNAFWQRPDFTGFSHCISLFKAFNWFHCRSPGSVHGAMIPHTETRHGLALASH